MNVESSIREKVSRELQPQHMELLNESHMHAGPATDSHFKLTVVAEDFEGLSQVRRHQLIYRLLGEELAGPVHALALHTYSPREWGEAAQAAPASPNCRGGSGK